MPERTQAGLPDFVRTLCQTNPFRSDRVSDPSDVRADVAQINEKPFARLRRYAEAAQHERTAMGVMLLGESGVGKSHLLARLLGWAREQQCIEYVFLHNLQASPERMGRYLLKATINALLSYRKTSLRTARLFDLLNGTIPVPNGKRSVRVIVRELARDSAFDDQIAAVLVAFMEALAAADVTPADRQVADAAIEWLSGETIDPDHARRLGELSGHVVTNCLPDDAAVERVVILLARLLGEDGRSLVLCLDQVDNLHAEQLQALAVFLHSLIDHARNLLVICSGVKLTLYDYKERQVIPLAAWDRIAQVEIDLHPVNPKEARTIVEARLAESLDPFAGVGPIAAQRRSDALFPLGSGWLDTRLGELVELRPRDVLRWSADRWEEQQDRARSEGIDAWLEQWRGPPSPRPPARPLEEVVDEAVLTKLEERRAERLLEPNSLPPDADNLLVLTSELLTACLGRSEYSVSAFERPPKPRRGPPPAYDLVVTERSRRGEVLTTALVFIVAAHPTAVTHALRRAAEDPSPPHHVILVTDERRPLRCGAKGQEHYGTLLARGEEHCVHLNVPFAEYAQLDAMVSLLGQARVNDFEVEHEGQVHVVSEAELRESLHRLDQFRAHPLLHDLITEEGPPVTETPPPPPFDDSLVDAGIRAYLSWRTGATATEVANKLLEDQDRPDDLLPAVVHQVIRLADALHRNGVLHSAPEGRDRYLLWLGKA